MVEAYLSRLTLAPTSREVQRDLADVQALHRRVMSAFPERGGSDARRQLGVLFRLESGAGGVNLLVQATARPDWSRLPSGYLETDWLSGADGVAVTSMSNLIARCVEGAEFRFRFRANPTRCIESKTGPDGRRRGKKVPLRKDESRQAWLLRKAAAHGFEIVESRFGEGVVDAIQREPLIVRGRRAEGQVTVEGVVFEGRLRVTDASAFREALLTGIGRGRAYGFGLMSVAPI